MNVLKRVRNGWFWFLSVSVVLGTAAAVARGATYNFYFNNTEQGDNSTATPAVNVSTDGKGGPATVTKTGANGLDSAKTETPDALKGLASDQAAAVKASAGDPAISVAKSTDFLAFDFDQDSPKWRISLSGILIPQSLPSQCLDWGCWGSDTQNDLGAAIGISYFPLAWLGFSAYTGLYHDYDGVREVLAMGEVELLPLRLSIAGIQDVFELGALAGVDNISERADGAWSLAHVGVRANINLSRRFGVTAAARFAPTFLGAEAGLTLRL